MHYYRITSTSWDRPPRLYKEFDAASDEEARRIFQEEGRKADNAWDGMMLFRIDPEEIRTHLSSVRISR